MADLGRRAAMVPEPGLSGAYFDDEEDQLERR